MPFVMIKGVSVPLVTVRNQGRASIDLSRGPVGPGSDVTGAEIDLARDDAENARDAALAAQAAAEAATAGNVNPTSAPYNAVGDGTADDTTAYNAASTASAGGGVVKHAALTHKVTGTVTLQAPGRIEGRSTDLSILNYTGTGTAVQLPSPGTVAQKMRPEIARLTVNAATATTGINFKNATRGELVKVAVNGVATNAAITAGTIGIKVDGANDPNVGAWYNLLDRVEVNGWDTGVKFTGVDNAGQANQNRIQNGRIGWYNTGVWGDQGDHGIVDGCDLTCTKPGSVAILLQDEGWVLINNRFESVPTAIRLLGTDGSHSAGARRTYIAGNMFAAGAGCTGIIIENGAGQGTIIGPNYWAATLGTKIVDNTVNGSDSTKFARYSHGWQLLTFIIPAGGLTAGATITDLIEAGGTAAKDNRNYMGRAYQIRGIAARPSTTVTAGSVVFTPKIGSTASTTLSVTVTGAATQQFQGMGKDTNTGTSGVAVQAVADGSYAPVAGTTWTVKVWIEFTDGLS